MTYSFKTSQNKKILGSYGTSVILLDKNSQEDGDGKVTYNINNDRIVLVAGTNSAQPLNASGASIARIDPSDSAAGIIINQSTDSYVLNELREEDGFILDPPVNCEKADKENGECKKRKEKLRDAGASSAVTLFGDAIQLVSLKDGVNIYTQRRNTKDSKAIDTGGGVSLIHGGDIEGLEPMVKGDKLKDHLGDINTTLQNLANASFSNTLLIAELMAASASHTHLTPQAPVGVLPNIPSVANIILALKIAPTLVKDAINNIVGSINNVITELNSLKAFESGFTSDYHKLN